MISNYLRSCQHGVLYDLLTDFCFHIDCKYERRLRNPKCPNCYQHFHDDLGLQFHINDLPYHIHTQLCLLEYRIQNFKTNNNEKLQSFIEFALSLIKNYCYIDILTENLIFKCYQITQLLQVSLLHEFDQQILEIQYIVHEQSEKQELNLTEKNHHSEITKCYYGMKNLNVAAISPDGQYLLIGTFEYLYLYIISQKCNIKIWKERYQSYLAQFSSNSKQIIHVNQEGIEIYNIQTEKYIFLKKILSGIVKHLYVSQSSMYVTIMEVINQVGFRRNRMRLIKFDLKQNRQIYALRLIEAENQIYFQENLITYQSYPSQLFINDSNRKPIMRIFLNHYSIQELIPLNTNQLLTLQKDRKLILWKIDYKENCLQLQTHISLSATHVFCGYGQNGYFYLIKNDKLFIIDANFNQIYCGLFKNNIEETLRYNTKQLNTDYKFLVFQDGMLFIPIISIEWLCLLQINQTVEKQVI